MGLQPKPGIVVKWVKILKTEIKDNMWAVKPTEACGKVLGLRTGQNALKIPLLLFNIAQCY